MARSHIHAQHFLKSPRLVAELVGHSNIRKNDIVYDLGAGSGVITSVLATRCKQVVAVEIESIAVAKLKQNTLHLPNVTILVKDILEVSPPQAPYKIFANIPFNLSASIMRKFTEHPHAPTAMYVIVQKQFARKLTPGNDHFTGQLGAQIGVRYTARIRRPLRRSDFTPPPGVDTVLLELKLRDKPLLATTELPYYYTFVTKCFAQQKYFISLPRHRAAISSELIPSQLTLEQWVALYRTTSKH